ncbi:PilZ domain-containing protein [Nitratiruptor tergarcus]|uniref:PilZ domain-containing protein n=1 Tax=Nitratiruptor tergarcus DSM 16512 TaxID=1069081 RepID=A0A1W1WS78_9BACT|nr:PilZ domain-containing protein [Nitratiruptor tergarcus]SMC08563.1 PilZ domain-containing protein [Nitratiruptor tergarcus DSM 16512]
METMNSFLSKHKAFFSQYKEHFLEFFRSSILEKPPKNSKPLSSGAINTIAEKLYLILFTPGTSDREQKIINFAYMLAQNRFNILPPLTKSLLKLLQDFIGIILQKEHHNHLDVSIMIQLIDNYIVAFQRGYTKFFEEQQQELRSLKHENDKKEQEIILSILEKIKRQNSQIILLDFYKQVPISCKAKIRLLKEDTIVVDIAECNFKIFHHDKELFIKTDLIDKPIKTKIKEIKDFDYVILDSFCFEELPQEKRKFVRVQPKESIPITITSSQCQCSGVIQDISIGGAGIICSNISSCNKRDSVTLQFALENKKIVIEGEIRYLDEEAKRLGIQYSLDVEFENFLAEYILHRQFEIIKEIRI